MNRRRFLSWVGVGGIATYLPMAIVACSPQDSTTVEDNETTTADTPPPIDDTLTEDGFIAVGTVAQLKEKGHVTKKVNDVIVVKNPDTSELIALQSLCTHQGCTVKWDSSDGNLSCPCHNSSFDLDGNVIEGPATKPLEVYEVKEKDGNILVKLT